MKAIDFLYTWPTNTTPVCFSNYSHEGKGRQEMHGHNVKIIGLQNENVPVDSYSVGAIILLQLWNMDNWAQ